MAWSEAARRAALEARRRKAKGSYPSGIKFRDNDGGGPYELHDSRRTLLREIAEAKNTVRGKVGLFKKTPHPKGGYTTSGGQYKSKSAASRALNKMRKHLYGRI